MKKITLTELVRTAITVLTITVGMAATPLTASALTVPRPSASDGTSSSYIRITWSRVSGARGYYVKRSTSSSYSSATTLKKVGASVVALKDSSATAGRTYYYWVCPISGSEYWYDTSKYDSGYRKGSSSTSMTGASTVKVGTYITLTLKGGNAAWYTSNANGYLLSSSGRSVRLQGLKPGSVTVYAKYNGKTYSKTITVTSNYNQGTSGGQISGPASVRAQGSAYYYLYVNGKKVTSNSVSWSRSGKGTMQDKGYYGFYKVTNAPSGKTKVTIIAKYNGRRYTKSITLYR